MNSLDLIETIRTKLSAISREVELLTEDKSCKEVKEDLRDVIGVVNSATRYLYDVKEELSLTKKIQNIKG